MGFVFNGLTGFGVDDLTIFQTVNDRIWSGFVGADADGIIDGIDEYLAVANMPRVADLLGGFDNGFDGDIVDDNLYFYLRQQFLVRLIFHL